MRDQLVTDLAKQVGRKPSKAGQVRRSSATLLSWDPENLRGSVDWNGTIIRDIPLLGAIDAFGWAAGDEVVIDTIPGTAGGFSSPMILGRVFRPGAANAAKVLQSLQSELAQQIMGEVVEQIMISPEGQELSAFVFAQRIHFAEIATTETRTTTTYGDLATPGPTVSNVSISDSGTAIVLLGASILATLGASSVGVGGAMAVEVSGATSISPTQNDEFDWAMGQNLIPGQASIYGRVRASAHRVITGLNPGLHTFQAKYRSASSGEVGSFRFRSLIVIAL